MRSLAVLLTTLSLVACTGEPSDDKPDADTDLDADADGFPASVDCDDTNGDIFPGAVESCDGLDQDCDGEVDEGAVDASVWYADGDGDGYGDIASPVEACEAPSGFVSDATDCDDADAAVSPGASEICNDVDDDCDGAVDDDDDGLDTATAADWFLDGDGDGHGRDVDSVRACEAPTSDYVDAGGDCDDGDATINPDAAPGCDGRDLDCDGDIDNDGDGDGFSDAACGGQDCDDAAATTFPGAVDAWYDGIDADCAGDSDYDADLDGFDAELGGGEDCDDGDAGVSPAETEVWYDGVDTDCAGDSDYDADGDGHDSDAHAGDDCDDADASVSPSAAEVWYDGVDADCAGDSDYDADADGYDSDAHGGDDCDDTDAGILPEPSGGCALGADCQDVYDAGFTADGTYTIDPDGYGTGEDPIDVYCDQTTDGGGWTLCASLTKGYVPADMLYNADLYAFQARLNGDNDYVLERDAPGRTTASWAASETLNYGQFCRHMGTGVSETWLQTKTWDYSNDDSASLQGTAYDAEHEGVFSGNLFLQWFTNTSTARVFSNLSGEDLTVQSDNNGYGGPYTTPTIYWSDSTYPRTQSTGAWGGASSSVNCTGCLDYGSGYDSVPYTQDTILNDLSHSFWSGIPNVEYGWSDCTADGWCAYHESGAGVWLFWVR